MKEGISVNWNWSFLGKGIKEENALLRKWSNLDCADRVDSHTFLLFRPVSLD